MPDAERDQVTYVVDRAAGAVRATIGAPTREAKFYGDPGCIIPTLPLGQVARTRG